MIVAAILAYFITPKLTTRAEPVDFEALIPLQFGEWRMEDTAVLGIINPRLKETLEQIYTQTLSRTYVNSEGRRIMLSLAYGADQSIENRVHRPEVCYPAQGFTLHDKRKDVISEDGLNLPVMRMTAQAGDRHEPLTYWIRFGDTMVRGPLEQSLARIHYGLQGNIPDGLLFRVSEINLDAEESFALQDEFIRVLLKNLTPEARKMVIGSDAVLVEVGHG
jgi:EpsI family protein